MKNMRHIIRESRLCLFILLISACSEKEIPLVDTSYSALTILKGEFNGVTYPENYSFNAYYLGSGSEDYTLQIPVRVSGLIDYEKDREYTVRVNPEKTEHAIAGKHYIFNTTQLIRKGFVQDSILLTIRIDSLNEAFNYKIYLELVPDGDFKRGVYEYSFIEIDFMKNINTIQPFWANNSTLKKFTYHPRKCAVFLQISKITDPEWKDPGNSVMMDYWVSLATQWFLEHEELDEKGERIYFNE